MGTKDEILKEVGNAAKESPRSGIIPDLADVLMIEVLIDFRDVIRDVGKDIQEALWNMPNKD